MRVSTSICTYYIICVCVVSPPTVSTRFDILHVQRYGRIEYRCSRCNDLIPLLESWGSVYIVLLTQRYGRHRNRTQRTQKVRYVLCTTSLAQRKPPGLLPRSSIPQAAFVDRRLMKARLSEHHRFKHYVTYVNTHTYTHRHCEYTCKSSANTLTELFPSWISQVF